MLGTGKQLFASTYQNIIQQPQPPCELKNKNVSGNEISTLPVKQSRAPREDIFRHCSKHISGLDNQTMLAWQLDLLRDQIREDIKQIHPNRGVGLTTSTVSLIFSICKSLKLTDGIKFATLEIYDRLLEKYNGQIDRVLLKVDDKATVLATIARQNVRHYFALYHVFDLRQNSMLIPIYPSQLQKVLRAFHTEYELDQINESELKVMNTLDYKLKYVNSFDILECILTSLELEVNYTRQIYDLSVRGLEYVCKHHEEVYTIFRKNWKENCGAEERKLFRAIEFNKGIEAAGILAGVICMLRVKDEKRLLSAIAKVSGTEKEEFMILATILFGVMIGAITPTPVPKKRKKDPDQNQGREEGNRLSKAL